MHRPSPPAPPSAPALASSLILLATLIAGLASPAVAAAASGTATVDAPATALSDTVHVAVVPVPTAADAGDTVLVELTVPVAGPAFNAYDAYLTYDPAVLQFLPAANVSTQEGPLMTSACSLRFHVFQADTLAGRLRVSHSLMCAGRSVTGPGVLYRVKFRCREANAETPLTLLLELPHETAFYLAGMYVTPLAATGATVRVGAPWAAPVPPGSAGDRFHLRATPNPFNPRTTITFAVDDADDAAVTIHAVDGRLVRRLWEGRLAAGPWSGLWDGRDDDGHNVAAGVYLVRVRTAGGTAATRVALVR